MGFSSMEVPPKKPCELGPNSLSKQIQRARRALDSGARDPVPGIRSAPRGRRELRGKDSIGARGRSEISKLESRVPFRAYGALGLEERLHPFFGSGKSAP